MKFSNNWFSLFEQNWNDVVPQYNPSKILEIGSFEGQSVCHLINTLGHKHQLDITCIDTWEGGHEHSDVDMKEVEALFDANIRECIDSAPYSIKIRKMKSTSWRALSLLMSEGASGTFDMVYVDGSHLTCDVFGDAVMSYDLLKVNGLLIFDDYLWGQGPGSNPLGNPKMAIDSFLNCFQNKVTPLRNAPIYQLYCHKMQ